MAARDTAPYVHSEVDGALQSYCWCKGTLVMVPVDEVRAGRTLGCGKSRCTAEHPSARHVPGQRW